MVRHLLPFLLLILSAGTALPAQAPPGYYNSVDTSSAANLRSTLHAVIDDHRRFPYTASSTDTWDILEQAWRNPSRSGYVVDVYRNRSFRAPQDRVTGYNREHTWPRSQGFPIDNSANYPFTDCHALMLSDAGYNSSRSNRQYEDLSAGAAEYPTDFTNGVGGGSGGYPGQSNWGAGSFTAGSWQVWAARRGDIARALLYLDVRYEGGTHGSTGASEPDLILVDDRNRIVVDSGNNRPMAYAGMLATLLAWHSADPVDAEELRRNDVVYGYQGNRNPFVDHPEWVAVVWGLATPGSLTVYGAGCLGSNGFEPRIGNLGEPLIGRPLNLTVTFAPQLQPAVLNLDLGRRQIDLAGFGFPGCTAHALAVLSITTQIDFLGSALLPLPLPNDPQLVGASLYGQWLVLDPAGSGLATSPGAQILIGTR